MSKCDLWLFNSLTITGTPFRSLEIHGVDIDKYSGTTVPSHCPNIVRENGFFSSTHGLLFTVSPCMSFHIRHVPQLWGSWSKSSDVSTRTSSYCGLWVLVQIWPEREGAIFPMLMLHNSEKPKKTEFEENSQAVRPLLFRSSLLPPLLLVSANAVTVCSVTAVNTVRVLLLTSRRLCCLLHHPVTLLFCSATSTGLRLHCHYYHRSRRHHYPRHCNDLKSYRECYHNRRHHFLFLLRTPPINWRQVDTSTHEH